MKKTLLSCLALVSLVSARAQVSFAPELGLHVSKYRITSYGYTPPVQAHVGLRLGGVADVGLGSHLSIQPGLFYVMNGINVTSNNPAAGSFDLVMSINTLEVPLNVVYKFGDPKSARFFISAGPYLGVNLDGTEKVSALGISVSQSMKIGDEIITDDVRRLDMGFNLNAGYELDNGFFFRARYQLGLANLAPGGNGSDYLKSSAYGVSAGYFFRAGHAKKNAAKKTTRSSVQ